MPRIVATLHRCVNPSLCPVRHNRRSCPRSPQTRGVNPPCVESATTDTARRGPPGSTAPCANAGKSSGYAACSPRTGRGTGCREPYENNSHYCCLQASAFSCVCFRHTHCPVACRGELVQTDGSPRDRLVRKAFTPPSSEPGRLGSKDPLASPLSAISGNGAATSQCKTVRQLKRGHFSCGEKGDILELV